MSDVTRILESLDAGDVEAAEELLPLVYEELRGLAFAKLGRERPGQTLQPTALVHEAWLRLAGSEGGPWKNRVHFLGAAAEAMRRILIEIARKKARQRRGGGWQRVDLTQVTVAANDAEETHLAVNDALERLEAEDPLKARIVKLRYFVGMTHREIADALEMSEPTVRRHWAFARSWLYAELKSQS